MTFDFTFEYVMSHVHHNQDRWPVNGTQPFTVYADLNLLYKSTNTNTKSKEALLVASKEVGLE
jgi:hypothetical protein